MNLIKSAEPLGLLGQRILDTGHAGLDLAQNTKALLLLDQRILDGPHQRCLPDHRGLDGAETLLLLGEQTFDPGEIRFGLIESGEPLLLQTLHRHKIGIDAFQFREDRCVGADAGRERQRSIW